MLLAARLQSPWLAPLLAGLAAFLIVPAGARAKVTCDARGARTPSVDLRGLPRSPVVARTYTVRLVTRTTPAVNPGPALATIYCGAGTPVARTRPANGRFRRAGDPAQGVFDIRLRFPRAGPWAVSLMDLDGTFHDLGRRTVRPHSRATARPPSHAAGGSGPSAWAVLAVTLLGAAALTGFRARR
jgi:hypothetical protein